MSDITKCRGTGCDQRETCWRYLAPADPLRQSWSAFDSTPKPCAHYWPIEPEAA